MLYVLVDVFLFKFIFGKYQTQFSSLDKSFFRKFLVSHNAETLLDGNFSNSHFCRIGISVIEVLLNICTNSLEIVSKINLVYLYVEA